MSVKIGDKLPGGKLMEAVEFDEAAGCPMNPQEVDVAAAAAGKRIAIFALPGAYTPTCSAKHLPGYLAQRDALRARGVDEIWCVATNDAFVMGAWGHDQGVDGRVRMLGDGNAAWTRVLGLELDRSASGMGLRMQRFSMLVEDGVVKRLNIEAPGKFEVSDGDTLLRPPGPFSDNEWFALLGWGAMASRECYRSGGSGGRMRAVTDRPTRFQKESRTGNARATSQNVRNHGGDVKHCVASSRFVVLGSGPRGDFLGKRGVERVCRTRPREGHLPQRLGSH